MSARLAPEKYAQVVNLARERGCSIADVIRLAIYRHLRDAEYRG